jgi:hypothetical protein
MERANEKRTVQGKPEASAERCPSFYLQFAFVSRGFREEHGIRHMLIVLQYHREGRACNVTYMQLDDNADNARQEAADKDDGEEAYLLKVLQ